MAETGRLPVPCAESYDWQRRAACRNADSEVFFHPEAERGACRREREQAAKRVCAMCPVAGSCLEHALRAREPYGVWGGLSETERDELRRHRSGRRRQHSHGSVTGQHIRESTSYLRA